MSIVSLLLLQKTTYFMQPVQDSTNSNQHPSAPSAPNRARTVMTSSSQCIRNCRHYGAVRFLFLYIIFINLNQCAACARIEWPIWLASTHHNDTHASHDKRDLLMERNVCVCACVRKSAMCRVHQFVTLYTWLPYLAHVRQRV